MWRPTVTCPVCNAVMPWTTFHTGKPWVCPRCYGKFQISRSRANVLNLSATALAGTISYAIGARGWLMAASVVILWAPMLLACVLLLDRTRPPRLKAYQRRDSDSKEPFDSSAVDLFHNRPK
jgi:hypothetical protein